MRSLAKSYLIGFYWKGEKMEKPQIDRAEKIDAPAIVLDINGEYPRKLIVMDKDKPVAEYRIIRTKNGGFCLNK
jgi:hypothetical protein